MAKNKKWLSQISGNDLITDTEIPVDDETLGWDGTELVKEI